MKPTDKNDLIHKLQRLAKEKGLILNSFYDPKHYKDDFIAFIFQARSFTRLVSDAVYFHPDVDSEEWLLEELSRVADEFLKEEIE